MTILNRERERESHRYYCYFFFNLRHVTEVYRRLDRWPDPNWISFDFSIDPVTFITSIPYDTIPVDVNIDPYVEEVCVFSRSSRSKGVHVSTKRHRSDTLERFGGFILIIDELRVNGM